MRRLVPYLLRRHETYYFRIVIPKPLQATFGRREIVHSLQTSEVALARQRARFIANHIEHLFDKVALMRNATRPQIDAMVIALFQKLKEDRVDRLTLPYDMTREERRELLIQLEEDYTNTQREHLTRGFPTDGGQAPFTSFALKAKSETDKLGEMFEAGGYSAPQQGTPDFHYALVGMREASEEVARLELAKVKGANLAELTPQGRFGIVIHSPLPLGVGNRLPFSPLPAGPEVRVVMDELVEQKLRSGYWKQATLIQHQPKLREFLKFLNIKHGRDDMRIDEVTYTDLRDFQNYLTLHTTRNNAQKPYSRETIRKHMSLMGMLLQFAVKRDYILRSPYVSDLFTEKVKGGDAERYRDFTIDEINQLFGSHEYNDKRHYGQTSHWWMPLLGLFTGARQGELIELRTEDIQTEEGVDFIHITSTDEHDIKNGWSKRKVPVHPVLTEMGFLKFVASRRKAGIKPLFTDIVGQVDSPQKTYSQRFGRFLDKLEMIDPLLVYHSFRHTFITHMRIAKVSKDDRMAITGHAPEDVHDRYGERPPVKYLAPEIVKLDYGIDWKSLLVPQNKPKQKRKAKT